MAWDKRDFKVCIQYPRVATCLSDSIVKLCTSLIRTFFLALMIPFSTKVLRPPRKILYIKSWRPFDYRYFHLRYFYRHHFDRWCLSRSRYFRWSKFRLFKVIAFFPFDLFSAYDLTLSTGDQRTAIKNSAFNGLRPIQSYWPRLDFSGDSHYVLNSQTLLKYGK